ncbi:hypothetical protein SERLA73DRAFT_174462 [Serpula lacrymans var. lacrymans S7.3]|uniref:Uncharacterized protein n=1 Tax=Serpula lacrymans var. lacrymans (strain S7.3) TaxID=936435 RepID=F8PG14_SERL3|nr:hypothetical protein SERLA73DRAFT_174462 [Serpula lacrymans var. lacrymans S7.3]
MMCFSSTPFEDVSAFQSLIFIHHVCHGGGSIFTVLFLKKLQQLPYHRRIKVTSGEHTNT